MALRLALRRLPARRLRRRQQDQRRGQKAGRQSRLLLLILGSGAGARRGGRRTVVLHGWGEILRAVGWTHLIVTPLVGSIRMASQ